jgi:hypothetical protein
MKTQLLFGLLFSLTAAAIAHAQIAPPYLTSVSPTGAQRGSRVTLTVEGFNLSDTSEILWNKPGLTGKLVLNSETARVQPRPSLDPTKKFEGDRGTRNRVQIEISIDEKAEPGIYSFRLKTPLGTTNLSSFYVGALRETAEQESNDSLAEAQRLSLPTTVVGELQQLGDADSFKFTAKAGQQLVFNVVAAEFGSKLDAVLTLFDAQGRQLAENNDFQGQRDALLAHTFAADGDYTVRLTDLEKNGQPMTGARLQFAYRLNAGELTYLTGLFPLGLRAGTTGPLALQGFNLDTNQLTVNALAQSVWNDNLALRPRGSLNSLPVALGRTPEIHESVAVKTLANPQAISVPVTINGKLNGKAGEADFFQFQARQGQQLILEVEAQRYGSPLDAVLEIYDAQGKLVPRALLRCLLETQQTLNDRDSAARGIRLLSWNGINVNDYILAGNELLQVDVLPKGPDEDTFFKSFNGQRLGFLDTTPEAHAVNSIHYKVSIHPPDAKLPPNGLPIVTLYYRNDDGGPLYGKDARLHFTAPATGRYTVRLRDVRELHGDLFAYRLIIRDPAPDFVLTVNPENPNVPRGAALPLTVTAFRVDNFAGDIEVKLLDLPAGFSATTGTIRAGESATVLLLTASPQVNPLVSFPLRVQGSARAKGQPLVREVKTSERLAVASVALPPELLVWTEQERVVLEPGGTAWVNIKLKRAQGFEGRVPFDVRNLPHGVIVKDVGLNGVLITETEETQRFELYAEPWVQPLTQPIFVVGRIETASPQRLDFPAKPLTLVIQAKPPAIKAGPSQ